MVMEAARAEKWRRLIQLGELQNDPLRDGIIRFWPLRNGFRGRPRPKSTGKLRRGLPLPRRSSRPTSREGNFAKRPTTGVLPVNKRSTWAPTLPRGEPYKHRFPDRGPRFDPHEPTERQSNRNA
jgi:hypothetical protein